MTDYLWLIPGLPLLAGVLTALFGYRVLKGMSHWPCILAAGASCALSVVVLSTITEQTPFVDSGKYTWFLVNAETSPGNLEPTLDGTIGLRADALTAVMLVTVTFISTFIAIYSC